MIRKQKAEYNIIKQNPEIEAETGDEQRSNSKLKPQIYAD